MIVRGRALTSTLRPTASAVAGPTVENHFVHPQHIGPQLLVAEGVEAEDRLAISMSSFVVVPRLTSKLSCSHRGSEP
jgi:hypothetical protein